MPSAKDDVAVHPADSDAFVDLIAMLSYTAATAETFTLGLLQAEKSWTKHISLSISLGEN